jgi:16S rRNA (uracil1498-N3)-methyltransferase
MERFYLKTKFVKEEQVELKEIEHHHLSRVLRLRVGEETLLVNGLGSIAKAKIIQIEKERTILQILSTHESNTPSSSVFLGIPLMRPSKLEWVIEKGTEIGANGFFIYPADHSTQDSLSDHQMERLRTITISALKQSQRLFLPSFEILADLQSLLAKDAQILFGCLLDSSPNLSPQKDITTIMVTGPESGFSKAELELLQAKGKGVRLNPNILRAETAPLVALSLLCMDRVST